MAPISVGLTASGLYDVVLVLPLILRNTMRGSVGLTTLLQQQLPWSQMPSQVYSSYATDTPQVSFFSQNWASHWFIVLYVGAHYGVCFLLSGFHVTPMLTNGGSTVGVCKAVNLGYILSRHMCLLMMVCGPHQESTEWLLLPLLQVRGASCYLFSCLSAIPSIWWGIQLWRYSMESPDPSAFPIWWGAVFFFRLCSIQWHGQLQVCGGH